MTQQAKILEEMQTLIMDILKSGSTTQVEANKMDELEDQLFKQRCFKKSSNNSHDYQGEEIATLFFTEKYTEAIDKLYDYKITPEDFFGFIEYYYDDEHQDEELIEMFSSSFIQNVNNDYQLKCQAK